MIFILVLAVLVLVHEWGHFFVARKAGIKVEEFGFGFPPRLKAWKTKITTFSLNWLPLGGFVRLKGEDGSMVGEADSYSHKGPWTRAAVVVAGVVMNFLLAAVLFSVGFMIGAPGVVHDDLSDSARVRDVQTNIVEIREGSLAAQVGFEAGDILLGASVSNEEIIPIGASELSTFLQGGEFGELHENVLFVVDRDGEEFSLNVSAEDLEESAYVLGVGLIETGTISYPVFGAVGQGVKKTVSFTGSVVMGLYDLIRGLVVGQGVSQDVAGPVGIAVITKDVASRGFAHMIQFIAILSVNLGVLNLIPFPALDGGRLLFIGIELITGRQVNQKYEQLAHIVGFALLMLLIIVVTVQDVSRLGSLFSF